MGNCQWCGDSFGHRPECPELEVNALRARVAELERAKTEPLTVEQVADVIREATGWAGPHSAFFHLARAIEKAHGIGAVSGD